MVVESPINFAQIILLIPSNTVPINRKKTTMQIILAATLFLDIPTLHCSYQN